MKPTATDAQGVIIIMDEDKNGAIVATIPSYVKDKEKWARLFCAAPDMWEALIIMTRAYAENFDKLAALASELGIDIAGIDKNAPDSDYTLAMNAIKLVETGERGEG